MQLRLTGLTASPEHALRNYFNFSLLLLWLSLVRAVADLVGAVEDDDVLSVCASQVLGGLGLARAGRPCRRAAERHPDRLRQRHVAPVRQRGHNETLLMHTGNEERKREQINKHRQIKVCEWTGGRLPRGALFLSNSLSPLLLFPPLFLPFSLPCIRGTRNSN